MGISLSLPDIKWNRWSKKSFIDLKYVSYENMNTLWTHLASSLNDSVEAAESLDGKENGDKWKRKKKKKGEKLRRQQKQKAMRKSLSPFLQ